MKCHSYVGSVIAPISTITTYVAILAAPNVDFSNVLNASSVIKQSPTSSNHILLMIDYENCVKGESKILTRFLNWESVYT